MDPWLTAADLARIYRRAPSTIYHWASQDHWARTQTRPVRYRAADAQASYLRRTWKRYLELERDDREPLTQRSSLDPPNQEASPLESSHTQVRPL